MELFTLNRQFITQFVIDKFASAIWTERYYGDSEVELVVPPTQEMIQRLPVGAFVGLTGSKEIMMLETMNIESDKLKVTGKSLLSFLNNRFIRASAAHEDKYWPVTGMTAGQALSYIVQNMCISGPYLNGTINTGIANPGALAIPGLTIKSSDGSGANVSLAVPYGPLYDALRDIATTYLIGMQITLESVWDTGYSIQFRSYKGLDRTSSQTVNPPIRFSPQMDTLTKIKELQSISAFKTLAYSFAPSNPGGLATTPGVDRLADPSYVGFDLRASLVFAEDITTDKVGGSAATLQSLLNQRAHDELINHPFAKAVDGEITPLNQLKYGVNYNLGDLIEVQGNSGVVQQSRITEYIRAQDDAGERGYPTVAMLG